MRILNSKMILLYVIVSIYTVLGIYMQLNNISYYTTIINPICWLLIAGYATYILTTVKTRIKDRINKTQTVLIFIMIYLIIYYLLGLFFGYARSPYSHKIYMILLNMWAYISIIVFQEITRSAMIPSTKLKWYWYVITAILFTLIEISFYLFYNNFIDMETAFEYSCSVLLPALARNVLFTYLIAIGGVGCNLCYRIPITFASLLVPVFPDLEWFWTSLIELLLVLVIFIQINYLHDKKESRLSKRSIRKEKLIKKVPLLACVTIFVSFVAGIFHYMPVAIMSNSMAGLIVRGDVVVIEKLSDLDKENLEVNDIIAYQLDGSRVVHRIIKIKRNGSEVKITTQGDNNNAPDVKEVSLEQVQGKVLIKVPKIGYPAVLLNELFEKSKPDVEQGS